MSNQECVTRAHIEGDLRVIVAPPGCGKTFRLVELLRGEIQRGTPPDRIGFVTFSRPAKQQVESRIPEIDLPWLRTIHSSCFRLLGLKRDQILTEKRLIEFAKRHCYQFSRLANGTVDDLDDSPAIPTLQTPDDRLFHMHQWGRNRQLTVDQTLARCPATSISTSAFRLFAERLQAFKERHGLHDFSDLLDEVLAEELRLDIDVIFLDEAQDLSPQQITVFELWARGCARVYVAGDEDQAVYGFQGAEPSWLLSLARSYPVEILTQSRRVPRAAHALASRVIRRNRERMAKDYAPTAHAGRVLRLSPERALALVDGSVDTFILARNWRFLGWWERQLLGSDVPFVVEGHGRASPLGDARLVVAVETALYLRGTNTVPIDPFDLLTFFHFIPSRRGPLPWGVKKKVRSAIRKKRGFTKQQLIDELDLGFLLQMIENEGPLAPMTKLHAKARRYVQALLDRYDRLPAPIVRLATMHGSKGREARLVVVIPDMSRSSFKEYRQGGQAGCESENRLFYVAVTRTLDTLVLVDPQSRRHFDFPNVSAPESEDQIDRAEVVVGAQSADDDFEEGVV